jgi:CheY-like chemotaxis protein
MDMSLRWPAAERRGVEKAREEWHPDVVLADMCMPEQIDGVAAIRELRGSPDTEDIPILVVSAWERAKHKGQALQAGVEFRLELKAHL